MYRVGILLHVDISAYNTPEITHVVQNRIEDRDRNRRVDGQSKQDI